MARPASSWSEWGPNWESEPSIGTSTRGWDFNMLRDPSASYARYSGAELITLSAN